VQFYAHIYNILHFELCILHESIFIFWWVKQCGALLSPLYDHLSHINSVKVKVVPQQLSHKKWRDWVFIILSKQHCEAGWQVPFLAAFPFPTEWSGTQLQLGELEITCMPPTFSCILSLFVKLLLDPLWLANPFPFTVSCEFSFWLDSFVRFCISGSELVDVYIIIL
jgi:hypothetical protein